MACRWRRRKPAGWGGSRRGSRTARVQSRADVLPGKVGGHEGAGRRAREDDLVRFRWDESFFGSAANAETQGPLVLIVGIVLLLVSLAAIVLSIRLYLKTRNHRALSGVILGGFFLAMVVTGTLLATRLESSTGVPVAWDFLWPLGVLLGAVLLFTPLVLTARDVIVALNSSHWTTTPGTIVFSTISPPRGVFPIRYRYVVEQDHEGNNITFHNRGIGSKADLVGRYPLAAQVTVYYDPRRPARAVLEPGFRAGHILDMPYAVEYLIVVVLVLGLVLGPRQWLQEKAPERASERTPSANPDRANRNIQMIAWATRGDLERVKALLDDGAEVDAEDPANEATAAFYAAARGHLQVTRLLVEKGADLKVRARNGATALIDAIQVFHDNPEQWHKGTTLIEVVNYLLASGIDRDARDDDGATALDYAQRFKYLDVAAALRSTK
jgi:hypothetical protein